MTRPQIVTALAMALGLGLAVYVASDSTPYAGADRVVFLSPDGAAAFVDALDDVLGYPRDVQGIRYDNGVGRPVTVQLEHWTRTVPAVLDGGTEWWVLVGEGSEPERTAVRDFLASFPGEFRVLDAEGAAVGP